MACGWWAFFWVTKVQVVGFLFYFSRFHGSGAIGPWDVLRGICSTARITALDVCIRGDISLWIQRK